MRSIIVFFNRQTKLLLTKMCAYYQTMDT